ncbi:ArsR/SmtB family transcription factor [Streptomyces zagrosensis]|uniref:ArsR/SmtB family transcription factor n=1 Tax=Streptomyces zagrosensis TaxID=1042984 RepID=UPI001611DBBC|nr:metalloregulator ArsR/SmtB family transcription factor [Streptomyces zagrosensis]
MDEVFKALADASRRRLLDRLNERNGQSLRELSEDLEMSRQAVSKHLAVLEAARLVSTVRHGREKLHYLNPVPIRELADRWIGQYEHGRLTALSQLKRTLEERTMSKPAYVYVIYIQSTPQEIYRALTDPEFVAVYMEGTGPRSDWQVGSPVEWKMDPNGAYKDYGQRVLEAEPGKRLAYTWHPLQEEHREMVGITSDEEFAEATKERSQVTFTIEPAEEPSAGTKLTIVHDGFDSPDSKMLQSVSFGWTLILSGMKTLLEDGKRLAPAHRA